MKFLNRYIFIPALLIVFLYIFYLVYHEVKNKTIEQFNAEQLLIAKSASQGITDYFGNLQSDITFLSKFPEIVDSNENALALIKKFFDNRSTQIEAITRISPKGVIMYTYPENKAVVGMDVSFQKHNIEIIQKQKTVISDVFMAVQGYLAIAIHVPVFKGDEFQGSLAVLIAIDKIGKRYLENIKKGETGYAFLLSENNIEIFCPFQNHIGKSFVELSQSDQTATNLVVRIKNNDFGTVNCFHNTSEKRTKTERNINYYRVPLGNTYWTILISNPKAAATETITGFRNRLIILYAVFLVLILVYFYFFIKARKVLKEENKRKIAEKALSASEKRYQIFFENSMDAILLTSPDGGILAANPAACKMFGRSETEICQVGRNGLVNKSDPELHNILKEREEKGSVSGELNLIRKDGTVFPAEISSAIFMDEAGHDRTSIIIRDISLRKINETALQESENKYRNLFEDSADGIFVLDENNNVLELNERVCQMLGYPQKEMRSINVATLIHPDDLKGKDHAAAMKDLLSGKITSSLYHLRKKDGSYIPTELSTKMIGANRFLNICRDITERLHAEAKIKESESNLIALINNNQDAIWSIDRSYNYLIFNKSFADIIRNEFGLELKKGVNAKKLLSPKDLEFWLPMVDSVFAGEKRIFEHSHSFTGDLHYYQTSLNPIYSDDIITGISGMSIDITNLKETEQAISNSNKRYKSLFNESPVPLWEEDFSELMIHLNKLKKEGIDNFRTYYDKNPKELIKCFEKIKVLDVNQATLELHEAKDKNELLSNLEKIFTEKSLLQFKEIIIAIIEGTSQYESESETNTLTGELKYINLNLKIDQSNPNLNRAILATVDITERKHAEAIIKEADNRINQTLIESEKRYRTLFENINAGFVLFEVVQDDKGIPVDLIIVAANKLFEKTTGLINQEVTGKLLSKVLPGIENDAADWIGTYGKIALTGESRQFEQSSELLKVHYSVNAFQAEPKQCAVTFLDITENKNAQEEIKSLNRDLEKRVDERTQELSNSRIALLNLVEDIHEKSDQLEQSSKKLEVKNKELETFTYSVSHDLKAPLRGIDGYSRLLEEIYSDKLSDEGTRFIKSIREGTTQMNQLIEDLLAYSRLERSIIRNSKFKINDILENILIMLKNEISNNNIAIEMDLENLEIETDYDGLSIIMRNLIENAIKFSGKQKYPQIKILLKENVYSWLLQVEDNGIGFDMKYHNRIFEIFQRLNLPEQYEGTGIGLAMVSKSVERLKGKIWAESSPGNGAKFYLEIPKNQKS